MYAIVDIAGQQFKVEKDQKLFVHRIEGEAGAEVSFDKVLLIEKGDKTTFGNPVIKDAAVSARVIEHVKGDKVLVFKKKRRKGYKKLNGHRQLLTRIEITGIDEKAVKKATAKAGDKKPEGTSAAEGTTGAAKSTAQKKAAPKTAEKKATGAAATAKKSTATEKKTATKAASATKSSAAEKKAAPAKSASKAPAAEKKATTAKSASASKKPAAKKAEPKKSDNADKSDEKK